MSKANQTEAPAKVYNKTRGEHVKDVMIAVLVASIIAFIGGMQFANKQNATVSEAVKAVTLTQDAEATSLKK
jgi:cell division protein FtsN